MARLVMIGAAGLDWPSFQAMRSTSAIPSLASLAEGGEARWLTGAPAGRGAFSPANVSAWTSLATGVPPEVHGLVRESEAWSGGVRPASRASWRANPVWARLQAAGIASGSAGWPAARPGAAWEGLHIDEDFAQPTGKGPDDWVLPLDCAPPQAREALRPLRIHPTQITAKMLAPLVPAIATIDQSRDARLPRLAVAMARASSLQAAAVWLLGQ
ncbi:MAG: alkaline phosphatase family protein, partial [Caulobacteraceae bacterium]